MNRSYIIPPECQGQIVEVSYLQQGDILLRRAEDRSEVPLSPARVQHYVVQLDDDEIDTIEPWNAEPTPRGEWRPITELRAEQIHKGEV